MAHSKQILDELMAMSELVANLPTESPYQTPPGYFNTLPEMVLAMIKKVSPDEKSSLLLQPVRQTPYQIPTGYFDELPETILNKIKGATVSFDEEIVLPPLLLGLKTADTFSVPAGYFEELPSAILGRIKLQETAFEENDGEMLSPLLENLKKTIPFQVPKGYFEELPSDVIAGVNAVDYVNQELESYSTLMNELKSRNVYSVPDGYFENLGNQLLSTVKNRRKATVVAFNFSKKVLRYGIAALVTGVVSIAAWIFYQNNQDSRAGNELAGIGKISNDEIIRYLESTAATSVENSGTASFTMKGEDLKEILGDVPDIELQQYLEQHSGSKDLNN